MDDGEDADASGEVLPPRSSRTAPNVAPKMTAIMSSSRIPVATGCRRRGPSPPGPSTDPDSMLIGVLPLTH